MIQIGIALSLTHKKNIVHLDIKPENILVTDNFFFLADYGIAKYLDEEGDLVTIQEGDGRYCARELLSDFYLQERRSDP